MAAVWMAVPDDCVELLVVVQLKLISTSGMYLAAWRDMTIRSTAPMAKFGAMKAGVSFASAALAISAFCSSERPVVPTTGEVLCASAVMTLPKTTSGRVKSTMTSGCARAVPRGLSRRMPFAGRPTSEPCPHRP